MFEQEIELEKKEGSAFGPVLIILLLVGLFVGGIGVVIFQSKQTLKPEEATAAIETKLNRRRPSALHSIPAMSATAPGISPPILNTSCLRMPESSKSAKARAYAAQVDLTPAGKQFLASFPDVKGCARQERHHRLHVALSLTQTGLRGQGHQAEPAEIPGSVHVGVADDEGRRTVRCRRKTGPELFPPMTAVCSSISTGPTTTTPHRRRPHPAGQGRHGWESSLR